MNNIIKVISKHLLTARRSGLAWHSLTNVDVIIFLVAITSLGSLYCARNRIQISQSL